MVLSVTVSMHKILPVAAVLSIAIAAAASFWFGNQADNSSVPKIDGIVLHPASQINKFMLKDHQLKDFSTADLLGKWHLMFFGYTHCPDVCPTTLQTLTTAYEKMDASEREMISVVFVSVDPLRDTPEVLAEYLNYFNINFIGVTADEKNLEAFTRPLGIAYARSATAKAVTDHRQEVSADNYLMDHSSRILVINPRAGLQAYLRSPRSPQSLLDSVRKTQRFYYSVEPAK